MNNGGWGLRAMLAFSLFFVAFIIIAAMLINTNFNNVSPKKEENKQTTYYDLEVKMVNATKKYMTKNYKNLVNDIEIPVKLKTLVSSSYLAPIKDIHSKKECTGYVMFIKKDNIVEYKPYLKCDNYKTNGYNSNYD